MPLPEFTGDAGEDTWRMVAARNQPELIEEFLTSFPDHPRAMMARLHLVELRQSIAFEAVRQSSEPADLEAFADGHPQHPQAAALRAKALALREQKAWNETALSEDRDVLNRFLSAFPTSSRAELARERLRKLEAKLSEAERWAAIRARRDPGEISEYIWKVRFGPTVEEGRALLAEIAEEKWLPLKAKTGSLEIVPVRSLLSTIDASELHALARAFLAAKDKEEWERAQRGEPTAKAALERYLELFPDGDRRSDAHLKLVRLTMESLPPHLRSRVPRF